MARYRGAKARLAGLCPEFGLGSGVKKIRVGAIDLLEIFPLP
jgi:hypothetical protein